MENLETPKPEVKPEIQVSFLERVFSSIGFRLGVTLILVLFLLIPLNLVQDLIQERSQRERSVSAEISSKWGGAQVFSGPIVGIPFMRQEKVQTEDTKGKTKTEIVWVRDYVFLTANKTQITSTIKPEYLKRGIYQSVVYNADLQASGEFAELDLSKENIRTEDLLWQEAKLFIGLSDLKGLKGNPSLKWGNENLSFQVDQDEVKLFEQVLSVPVDLSNHSTKGTFAITAELRGTKTLTVFPTAAETAIKIDGAWSNPSFDGGFLPENREVGKDKFAADWHVMGFNRSFPQQWSGGNKLMYALEARDVNYYAEYREPAAASSSVLASEQDMVQVSFLESVNNYQKTTRVAKYGSLVILLTFTSLFFTEILKKQRVHFVQYILIGCAMVLFYALLLAIGEHLGFNWSYFVAALATIGLIVSFVYGITKDKKTSLIFAGILSVFYVFVFALMQLQDYALIAGSIGVFIILAVLMRLSIRVNWNQLDGKEGRS